MMNKYILCIYIYIYIYVHLLFLFCAVPALWSHFGQSRLTGVKFGHRRLLDCSRVQIGEIGEVLKKHQESHIKTIGDLVQTCPNSTLRLHIKSDQIWPSTSWLELLGDRTTCGNRVESFSLAIWNKLQTRPQFLFLGDQKAQSWHLSYSSSWIFLHLYILFIQWVDFSWDNFNRKAARFSHEIQGIFLYFFP